MAKTTAEKKAKNPDVNLGGHPTHFKPEYCEQLIEHMTEGLSYESFAGVAKVARKTLYNWETQHEAWAEAKEIAFEQCRIFWEKLGIDNIINESSSETTTGIGGSSNSKSLNGSVWIFNMKNRFGWRDRQPDEVDTIINNNGQVTDEQIDARIKELEAKRK